MEQCRAIIGEENVKNRYRKVAIFSALDDDGNADGGVSPLIASDDRRKKTGRKKVLVATRAATSLNRQNSVFGGRKAHEDASKSRLEEGGREFRRFISQEWKAKVDQEDCYEERGGGSDYNDNGHDDDGDAGENEAEEEEEEEEEEGKMLQERGQLPEPPAEAKGMVEWIKGQIRAFVDSEAPNLELPPMSSKIRWFAHQIAAMMQLKTFSIGEGASRRVIVEKSAKGNDDNDDDGEDDYDTDGGNHSDDTEEGGAGHSRDKRDSSIKINTLASNSEESSTGDDGEEDGEEDEGGDDYEAFARPRRKASLSRRKEDLARMILEGSSTGDHRLFETKKSKKKRLKQQKRLQKIRRGVDRKKNGKKKRKKKPISKGQFDGNPPSSCPSSKQKENQPNIQFNEETDKFWDSTIPKDWKLRSLWGNGKRPKPGFIPKFRQAKSANRELRPLDKLYGGMILKKYGWRPGMVIRNTQKKTDYPRMKFSKFLELFKGAGIGVCLSMAMAKYLLRGRDYCGTLSRRKHSKRYPFFPF
eukprot:jgi/Bigna1/145134/aug1.95_g19842